MAVRYTEEQLNTVDKSLLIQMVLNQQEQLGEYPKVCVNLQTDVR